MHWQSPEGEEAGFEAKWTAVHAMCMTFPELRPCDRQQVLKGTRNAQLLNSAQHNGSSYNEELLMPSASRRQHHTRLQMQRCASVETLAKFVTL